MLHVVTVEYEGTLKRAEPHQHFNFAVSIEDVQVALEAIL